MTRYLSIEEVNAAFVELEEHERSVSSDKPYTEKHHDAEKRSSRAASNTTSANGRDTVNGSRENGAVHEDGVDSDSDTGSGTIEPEGRDDEESDLENHEDGCDSEEDEDDEEAGGPASDEDDEVHVRQKVAEVDPTEEANFELELRAVMQARIIFHGYFICFVSGLYTFYYFHKFFDVLYKLFLNVGEYGSAQARATWPTNIKYDDTDESVRGINKGPPWKGSWGREW